MNIKMPNNVGRQWPLYALLDFDFTNVADTGVPVKITLPSKAVVIDGAVDVLTATDATTGTLDIGDATNPTRYTAGASLKTVGRTPLTMTDYADLAGEDLLLTPTVSGTPTMGKYRIYIGYLIIDRANEAQTA